jgi:hypothetical protein
MFPTAFALQSATPISPGKSVMRIGLKDILPVLFFGLIVLSPSIFEHFGRPFEETTGEYIMIAGGLGLLYFTLSLLTKTGK